jgi:methyl-accepting chemotaxis protein
VNLGGENPGKVFERLLNSSLFLIKWIILIIGAFFINFVVSKFVYIPQHADIFSLIEVLFAVIVTALSIVSSFAIASQWRELYIQADKLAKDIQVMKDFEQKAESFQQKTESFQKNAENSFQQINTRIAALEESSRQTIQSFATLEESSRQTIQSIDAIKENAKQNSASIGSLTTIAKQSQNDFATMKKSLEAIENAIRQLGNR